MAQDSTLHIKIEREVARDLKRLAKDRRQTVGELVRQAISSCYQPLLQGLTTDQRRAVEAYSGGYISIGKLAEVMGKSVIDLRSWLVEHSIDQHACFGGDDMSHA